MKEWIVFSNRETGEEYVAITLEGATRDEVKETIALTAYENSVPESIVTYALVER
jgi:hypothetical protein